MTNGSGMLSNENCRHLSMNFKVLHCPSKDPAHSAIAVFSFMIHLASKPGAVSSLDLTQNLNDASFVGTEVLYINSAYAAVVRKS